MDFSREKLVEIWRRVMPNDPPPEVFDTLAYPDGEPREAAQGEDYALFDNVSDAVRTDAALDPYALHEAADLRNAVQRELELTALYHALARWVLAHPAAAREDTRRGSRSVSRELMRLANEQFAAAKAVAGAHLLASGEYFFPAPERCEVASLREGLRRAWSLERELVAAYARLEQGSIPNIGTEPSVGTGPSGGTGQLRRMHSERSLELGGLLSGVFK